MEPLTPPSPGPFLVPPSAPVPCRCSARHLLTCRIEIVLVAAVVSSILDELRSLLPVARHVTAIAAGAVLAWWIRDQIGRHR